MQIYQSSSSAIQTYEFCAFKYFMSKILKMEDSAGKAALQGSIVHQVFEWMSKLKRKNKTHIDPMWLLDRAWDMHVKQNPHIDIRRITSRGECADFKKCRICVETILSDVEYNPYTMSKIIDGEKWFSLEMPGEEWQTLDRQGNKQQFALRGFIDLVREIDKDTIEIIDWKTGKRMDFYSREPIDAISLIKAIQPRLYHMASTELYPQYKNVILTFYYIGDGGPITISFNIDDIPLTLASIWTSFDRIKKDTLLRRNRSWKCRMCSYNKNDICTKVWSDLHTYGSEYIQIKYNGMTIDQQRGNVPDIIIQDEIKEFDNV